MTQDSTPARDPLTNLILAVLVIAVAGTQWFQWDARTTQQANIEKAIALSEWTAYSQALDDCIDLNGERFEADGKGAKFMCIGMVDQPTSVRPEGFTP